MGPTNALWSELNIGIAPYNCSFQHPNNENLKVYVFDMPHLMKLARNFFDSGFMIGEHRVDKSYLQRILSINARNIKVSFNFF